MSSFLEISFFLEDPELNTGAGPGQKERVKEEGRQCWTDAMAAGAYQTQVSILNIFKFLEFRNSSRPRYNLKDRESSLMKGYSNLFGKIYVN